MTLVRKLTYKNSQKTTKKIMFYLIEFRVEQIDTSGTLDRNDEKREKCTEY